MPEPSNLPNAPRSGLVLPTSRSGGDLPSGSVSSDPLASPPWGREDLPGIPVTQVPGDWAPVIPFGVEFGALADFYVLDLGVDLGTYTTGAMVDVATAGALGVDLGVRSIDAAASISATDLLYELDRDLGLIDISAAVDLTPASVGLEMGTVTTGAVADLAPTALTVNPDPSGSIAATAGMTPFGMAVDLGTLATGAAAEINQTGMALDLGTITTPAAAESGYTGLSSVYLFSPMGMDKSGTFAMASSITNGLVTGWAARSGYPNTVIASNALVSNGNGNITLQCKVTLTAAWSNATGIQFKIFKNGVQIGSTATIAFNTTTITFAPISTSLVNGDTITLRFTTPFGGSGTMQQGAAASYVYYDAA